MQDYNDLILSSESPQTIIGAKNAINPLLPLAVRRRLNGIVVRYMHEFGPQGMFDRMNNKSIGAIINEYERLEGLKPMDSGERGGVRFELYASPDEAGASKPDAAPTTPPAPLLDE